ncbi:unnamed protein product [Acanthoscelides obtectus]|uniref:Peptidase S1 domain-containing protein n=1 Tax=Acanthoscelides obtectus TaxID=200917 RepID=A0A9P0JSR2_ACAOB|nr:unnamed protein product [Acanthoscelides obtectus]CAK1661093.1 Mite allergen Der f 3 [Acanthoscelides obtectus]
MDIDSCTLLSRNTDLDVIISGYNNFKNYTRDAYVKIHQNYTLCDDNVTINDIALIRLENDIDIEKYNIYINQLQIMKGDTDVDGKEAVIIGMNSTTYKLEEAHLQVIDTTTCRQLCNTTTQLSSEFHICGFSNTTNASTCQGDSGGPLLLLDKNPIGVSAFTCAHNTAKSKRIKPSVFTRVSHYYEWICDMIDEKDEINEVCPDRSFPWYINFITFFGVIINVISPVNSNSAIIAVIAIIVIGIGLIGLILVWKCWTQRDSNSDKDEYEFRPLTTTGECQTK